MIVTSIRASEIQPSVTLAVNARANELQRQGLDIINLSAGEPDFDTPEFIKASAYKAIEEGFTKYTAVDGIPELKQAVIHKLKRDNQLEYSAKEIIVSNGIKHGLYNLCQAILNPGDEVIIPAPYWVSYPDLVKLADATPVFVVGDQSQDFKITPGQLEAAITSKTKLIFINSPSNPSGKAYNAQELKALAEVLKRHPHVIIATDDIYEYILWGLDQFVNIINVAPELKDRTVLFNGVSKAYAMTGWRIGYAAGPAHIIDTMKTIQSQDSGNPNSVAQKAAVTALQADKRQYQYMLDAFKERHDVLYNDLQKINGFSVTPADGTFYLFPNVSQAIRKLGIKDDVAFATYLLEQARVATVPGSGFGIEGHIRFSYAVSIDKLKEAAQRIAQICNK